MAFASMRGLQNFIGDVRKCQTGEDERARVEKELNKIRVKFSYEKLSSYDKKKYVCKLLYIHLLGYEHIFGHREVLSLIGASKYAEKQIGYLVASCLLNENHEHLNHVLKTVRLDIIGRSEAYQCMALTMVANIGSRDYAEALFQDVQKLAVSSTCRPLVRKKAVLCLLHFYRNFSSSIQTDRWPAYVATLLDEKDFGVLIVVMNLLAALVRTNPDLYFNCISKCVRILERLLRNQNIPQEYTFYGMPSPWLQVKTMQVLQLLPLSEDPHSARQLLDNLERVVIGTDIVQSVDRNNVMQAVLFEAMILVAQLDTEKVLLPRCAISIGKFLTLRDANLRCLGMVVMANMLFVADFRDSIQVYEPDVVAALREPDKCVQKAALELIYEMCSASSVKSIVNDVLEYFPSADLEFQEQIVSKVGLLAEKFAVERFWYVDVMLQLVERGGGLVPDEIWSGLVQSVSHNDDIQVYAATKCRDYLLKPTVHETMVKVAGSVLGETSHLMEGNPGFSPKEVFWALHDKFPNLSTPAKAVLLEAYVKLLMHAEYEQEELQKEVLPLYEKYGTYLDPSAQQLAAGYFSLTQKKPRMQAKTQEAQGPSSGQSSTAIAAQPAANIPEVDLLGDLMAPLVIGQNASAPVDPFKDALLSLDASAMVFSGDSFSTMQSPVLQPTGSVVDWYNALCKKDSGILYEDPYIQVGIKSHWQGPQGQMNIFLGNKQSAPLTAVQANYVPETHLRLELRNVPETLQPAAQVQAILRVTSVAISRAVPILNLSYVVSGITVSVPLRLPIVIAKFLQATSFTANDFFARWKALAAPPNKLQEVIRGVVLKSIVDISEMLNSLHFGVAPGLDPNVNNLVAATTFFSETAGAILCMVRIETDPADRSQLRLTVASLDPRVASEIKEYIKDQLLGSISVAAPLVLQTSATMEANPFAASDSFFFPTSSGTSTLLLLQQPQPDFNQQALRPASFSSPVYAPAHPTPGAAAGPTNVSMLSMRNNQGAEMPQAAASSGAAADPFAFVNVLTSKLTAAAPATTAAAPAAAAAAPATTAAAPAAAAAAPATTPAAPAAAAAAPATAAAAPATAAAAPATTPAAPATEPSQANNNPFSPSTPNESKPRPDFDFGLL